MNGSIKTLLESGFNANFFQRHTWFDSKVLGSRIHHNNGDLVSGKQWSVGLGISEKHFQELLMSREEYDDLNLTLHDVECIYGSLVADQERKRFGIRKVEVVQPTQVAVVNCVSSSNGYKIPI